jgi:hypothetical protein
MSRCLIVAGCIALGLAAAVNAAGAEPAHPAARLEAGYDATLLGLPIGRIAWTIELRDDRFAAAADGSTAGLLRIFANGHGAAKSYGTVSGKETAASSFAVSYTAGSASEDIKIAFSGGRARESLTPTPQPNPNRVPLSDAHRVGVVDPMTALLIEVPGSGDTAVAAACNRRIAVFDGHMRYDLRLAFKRLEQVSAPGGYRGAAVVCAVSFTPLAGYDPTRSTMKYLQSERGIEIWLAPLAGTRLMVPFRVVVPTPLGLGVLQATRFVWTRQTGRAGAISTN